MALFVLRNGYRVTTTPTGGVVTHVRTGDELPLSTLEVQLLARATAGGIDSDDPTVTPVFKKLANLGLLVRSPGEVPLAKQARTISLDLTEQESVIEFLGPPPRMGPLPRFRADLVVGPEAEGALLRVEDPLTARHLSLHDFELSLARMLNGQRTTVEVVAAAERLGIPIDGSSLGQFISLLEAEGFVEPPGSPPALTEPQRPPRTPWSAEVRERYQHGLKATREGHYVEAARAFEAVLAADPGNPEAAERLAEVERQLGPSVTEPIDVPMDEVTERPTRSLQEEELARALAQPDPVETTTDFELLSEVEMPAPSPVVAAPAAVPEAMQALFAANPPAPVAAAPAPVVVPVAVPAAGPSWVMLGAIYVVSVAAALGAGYAVGVSSAGATREVVTTPPVVVAVAVKDAGPAQVVAPVVVAVVDAGAPAVVEVAVAVVDAGKPAPVEVAVAVVDAGKPAPVEVAVAVVDAGAPVVATPKPVEPPAGGWSVAKIVKRGRVTMGTVEAPAEGTVTWTRAAQSVVKKGQAVGHVGEQALVVPKAGLLMPVAAEGAAVKAGELLANVVYTEGYIQATVALPPGATDWACEVADQATGQTAPCKVVTATPKGGVLNLTATTEPLWFDGCASPELRVSAK